MEIESFALRHSLKSTYLEDISFSEQVHLFRSSNLIIGAHGAGLSNIIFCDVEAKVIEILEAQDIRKTYYKLGGVLGIDYKAICLPTVNSQFSSKEVIHQLEMILPTITS